MLNATTRSPRAATKIRIQVLPAKESRAASPCREGTQLLGSSILVLYPTQ